MSQAKTAQSTTPIWRNISLGFLLKSVASFFLVTLSLFHVFFPSTTQELTELPLIYKTTAQKRDQNLNKLLDDLIENKITTDDFVHHTRAEITKSKIQLKELAEKKRKLSSEFAFRGRTNFRFWICQFGLVITILFFSFKSLYDDFSKGSHYKFHFVSISGIVVGIYWLIHILFLTAKDFDRNKYVVLILVCSVLFSVFIYFFLKNYNYKDDIIYKQLSFIERIKTIHLPKIALKALYSEKYNEDNMEGERVEEIITDFQKDLEKVTNEV